ncbi:hypothetical protein AVEN_77736-1 [Araneus ventricosus]|uniref:Integrase catalytic domain-containing protein n=1 Tax=Araneus ventricosus TaxID=182803 RepID=A0A4Y2SIF3_ARAVE|nr:hypothetical protein AVEN_77736-1 [Araneus ventricosus]
MGDLPRDRIVTYRPFDKVGINFAGPIITKPNPKRSKVTIKSYIAIFICFPTIATHLEVVSDLTTEACLLKTIYSNTIKTFNYLERHCDEEANAILNPLFKMCKSSTVQNFSTEKGIKWNFIPSPNFGRLWEENIKSMKKILLKVAKTTILNFEELTTLVTQIEAILNSRSLCLLSVVPTAPYHPKEIALRQSACFEAGEYPNQNVGGGISDGFNGRSTSHCRGSPTGPQSHRGPLSLSQEEVTVGGITFAPTDYEKKTSIMAIHPGERTGIPSDLREPMGDALELYIDGRDGAAMVVLYHGQLVHSIEQRLPDTGTVFQAELVGWMDGC